MGEINLDNTGSGSSVTLSSDGTSLLLDGTAIGGGGADLYAANESSPTSQPSATGTNAIAIGEASVSAGTRGIAINIGDTSYGALSGTTNPIAIGYQARVRANVQNSLAIGTSTDVNNAYSTAVGYNAHAFGTNAQAFGSGAYAANDGALALGHNAQAGTRRAVSLGNSRANGEDSFAAVITNNTTTYGAASTSSIAMGKNAKASGIYNVGIGGINATATGGAYALALGSYTTASGNPSIAIGLSNNATSTKTIAIGDNNSSSSSFAVTLGSNNVASSSNSLVLGSDGEADIIGKIVFSNGYFSARGDSQAGQYILRADTTDATPTVLTTNNSAAGNDDQIIASTDTCITFDGTIVAMQNGAQAFASFKIEGLLVNDGGTTTLANSATTVIDNQSSWGLALSADNTNNALAITVTGEASHNIRWVANIRTSEVTYA